MAAPRDPRALLEVARLYHVEGRSQAEVAALVGTGRSTVSRMLEEARRRGIVEIRLHDPSGRDGALEASLRERFGLADVRVAARRDGPRLARVGALAATLLVESLGDARTVGVSWGRAVQATVDAVRTDHEHDLTVLPLLGGTTALGPDQGHDVSGQELVRRLAGRLGASYRLLHAPATLGSSAACRALLAEPAIAETLAAARDVDVALVGIGTPDEGSSAAVVAGATLDPVEARDFWAHEPVGDLAGRFFDGSGRPVTGPLDDRVMAVGLDDLTRVPLVIGVAAGRAKAAAVLGALAGGRLDALVCDDSLARALEGDFPIEGHELSPAS